MASALLVLILERSRMVVLKSMGATNHQIQKLFLVNAIYIVGNGLLWGNPIGLGLLFGQHYFGLIPRSIHLFCHNSSCGTSLHLFVVVNALVLITCSLLLALLR